MELPSPKTRGVGLRKWGCDVFVVGLGCSKVIRKILTFGYATRSLGFPIGIVD